MEHEDILIKLKEYIPLSKKEGEIFVKIIDIDNFTFLNVRDFLFGLGDILEENFEETYYILRLSSGMFNKNKVIILVKWEVEKILLYGCAREGIIKQHTAEKAVKKLSEKLESHLLYKK